jgi:plastocyanin
MNIHAATALARGRQIPPRREPANNGSRVMKKSINLVLAAMAGVMVLWGSVVSAQWGDLKMRFVVDGAAPTLPSPKIEKDVAICTAMGKRKIPDEQFVVGKNGGVRDCLVFLVQPKDKPVKVHESYKDTEKDTIKLDNKGCLFVPHVLTVRVGQTLLIGNSDPTGHNSQYNFPTNKLAANPLIPPKGEHKVEQFTKGETRAMPVSCAIHPWMQAYVLVQDHPYMGVSDEEGLVEIKNIPVGKHEFQLWQDNNAYLNPTGGKVKTVKGKATIEIKEGVNDLGELKVKFKAGK